ncbi:hypothetical protein BD626DRAFT_206839 [Schizophyllum amplum]|uniref:Uncharacterized protein n=1 Tax=Schizophyllum amplum TaxID=97359 RepID=A0A550BZC7_9AGAR|nr:hypothetical protein BD626DRAFT_206839 [Auriculariopsis ampla]
MTTWCLRHKTKHRRFPRARELPAQDVSSPRQPECVPDRRRRRRQPRRARLHRARSPSHSSSHTSGNPRLHPRPRRLAHDLAVTSPMASPSRHPRRHAAPRPRRLAYGLPRTPHLPPTSPPRRQVPISPFIRSKRRPFPPKFQGRKKCKTKSNRQISARGF